ELTGGLTDAGPDTAPDLPPHARRQRDHVLVGDEVDVLDRWIADPDQRVGAVEPVRVLDDDLIGRLPVAAKDDARRDDREVIRTARNPGAVVVRVEDDLVVTARHGQPGKEAVGQLAARLPLRRTV